MALLNFKRLQIIQLTAYRALSKQVKSEIDWMTNSNTERHKFMTRTFYCIWYLVFIEHVTMVSRDPLNQLRRTKERPYSKANQRLL